jgi:hypothetical protein
MSRREIPTGGNEPWWAHVIAGLVCLGITVYLYRDLNAFEAAGGTRRMQWILAIVYNHLGKWPILILFSVAGLGLVIHGISQAASSPTGDAERTPKTNRKARLSDLKDSDP